LIVFLGSTQDFKSPSKVLPSPARPFSLPGGMHMRMNANFEAPIKKPPWAQTRAVFSYGRKGFTLWQQELLCAEATFL
jgi:hypothetical protein